MKVKDEVVSIGVAGSNILDDGASGPFAQELLEARLHAELRRGSPPKASNSDVTRDWNLLQKAMNGPDADVSTHARRPQPGVALRAGNQR
jgi:hypothetical protein